MQILQYTLIVVTAYLLGSIPFAYIVVRLFAHKNVMEHGTGNVGTMNTHRATNSKPLALLVLLGDVGKGIAAYFAARYVLDSFALSEQTAMIVAGLAVILGHNYSIYLHFKGGKGLATGAGFLFMISPLIVLTWLAAWLLVTVPTRIFVLGQILATVLTPLVCFFYLPEHFTVSFAVSIPIFIKHAPRIKNILDGTEPKMYYKVRKEKG